MPRIEMNQFDGGRTAQGAAFMQKIRIDLIWINVAATEIQ
jgi:hypothetical protein